MPDLPMKPYRQRKATLGATPSAFAARRTVRPSAGYASAPATWSMYRRRASDVCVNALKLLALGRQPGPQLTAQSPPPFFSNGCLAPEFVPKAC